MDRRLTILPTFIPRDRTLTLETVENASILDLLIDFFTGTLAGITYVIQTYIQPSSISPQNKFLSALLPCILILLWYMFKYFGLNRRHKVGDIFAVSSGYITGIGIMVGAYCLSN